MRIDAISIGKNPPEDVNVIVEVPVGGHPIKYEMDKEAGTLVVDRFLYTPMTYPGNYGFVPHTLSEDGDPIDVLIASTRPLVPGCVINVRPIGVLKMEDNSGRDEKIIAVPSPKLTLRYEKVREHTDLPEITLKQIEHFFEHYKDLEPGKWVKIFGWGGSKEAGELILEAIERVNLELGTLTVVITHNAIIADMADRVIHLSDGHIVDIRENTSRRPVRTLAW